MRLKSRRALSPTILPTLISLIAFAALLIACSGSAPAAAPTAQPATPQTSTPTIFMPRDHPQPTVGPSPTTAPAPTQPPPTPVPTTAPAATQAPPVATAAPTTATASQPAPTQPPPSAPATSTGGAAIFTLGQGTIARYKVEEVLARTGSWTATGETTEVAGQLAFDADGALIPAESRVIVQAATLATDSDRRDRYVRERTLNASQYPEIVFSPTATDGLPAPLTAAQGNINFTITGDLTIRDQTRPVTWNATADFAAATISGAASVEFTFADFAMDKPSVPIVLSVEDTIRLEIDFTGSLSQPSADADATQPADTADANANQPADTAPAAFVNTLGDENAPVTIIEFSDFQ